MGKINDSNHLELTGLAWDQKTIKENDSLQRRWGLSQQTQYLMQASLLRSRFLDVT